MQAQQTRAEQSPAPTAKYRNSVYNHTRTSRPIVGVGLCSTRRAFPPHTTQKKTRKFIVRRSYFLVHHRGLSRGLTNTALWCWLPPAGGRPVLVHGASQKRAPDPEIGGFFWCTISGSVQKTVQCTVFSDRSPRGECKLHSSAARARPVGDGAPCASLSITHNAKKRPANETVRRSFILVHHQRERLKNSAVHCF